MELSPFRTARVYSYHTLSLLRGETSSFFRRPARKKLNRFTISNSNPRTFTLIHEAARYPEGSVQRNAFIPASVFSGVETCQIGGFIAAKSSDGTYSPRR